MGCFSPDPPKQPNYGEVTRDTLQAQVDLAPQQYAAEANPNYGQPAYANLNLAVLNRLLNGTTAGTENYTTPSKAGQAGWYAADGSFLSPGQLVSPTPAGEGPAVTGVRGRGNAPTGPAAPYYVAGTAPQPGAVWRNAGDAFDITGTRNVEAQPGLLQMMRDQNVSQREADINDVLRLGPEARAAMLAANPDNAVLLGKLNRQANEGLDAGSNLTPEEQRSMQQASRAAFAARGMGGSNGAVADELLRQFDLGQRLLRQRQAFAQSVLGNNQAIVGDPFQMILSRNSGALPAAQQSYQQAGPQLFNPQAGLGLAASNYQTEALFNAAVPTTYQLIGQGFQTMNQAVSAVGNLIGGMK